MRKFKVSIGMAACLCLGIAMAVSAPLAAAKADYPDKHVTVIVAWGAGGGTDLLTRAIQPILSKNLGADIVVKNLPGAAGTIGTARAARAKPDGYTVLIGPAGPVTTQPHLRDIPYDLDSFDPVGRVAINVMVTMSTKESKYKTLNDIIEDAKANPNTIRCASSGAGTLPHIAILALNKAAGIQLKHLPYKGSSNAVKALLGGEADVFSDQAQIIPRYDLHAIASWSAERLPDYPNVPTMKELGYDFQIANWNGMFVPRGTPEAVIDTLTTALEKTLADKAVLDEMAKLKVDISYLDPQAFKTFAEGDYVRNRQLLKEAGLVK